MTFPQLSTYNGGMARPIGKPYRFQSRFTRRTKSLLLGLVERLGLNETEVVEKAIDQLADTYGVAFDESRLPKIERQTTTSDDNDPSK